MKVIKGITVSIFLILIIVSWRTSLVKAEDLQDVLSTPTPSIEYALPYPGILPTHPLYFLKQIRDRIILFFTHDPIKKSQLNLLLADKNLVMGQILWEQQNFDLSLKTLKIAENYLLTSIVGLVKLEKPNEAPSGVVDRIELAIKKHEEIIGRLITTSSNETKSQSLNDILGIAHQAEQQISSLK